MLKTTYDMQIMYFYLVCDVSEMNIGLFYKQITYNILQIIVSLRLSRFS